MNFYSWEAVFEIWKFIGFALFAVGGPVIVLISIIALIIFLTEEKP